ncbi:hypothetical protein GOP47_0023014 [Adiantum capillus-veneris]|uniref:Uncharacterized protein n=1 Tax=Adiantum capillus-veneris TaxID=13818 RepID=A0A9D4U7C8_ADICA|nr:hypothetical protein GOP47_0023014 [Adiantum capillus-veneris]
MGFSDNSSSKSDNEVIESTQFKTKDMEKDHQKIMEELDQHDNITKQVLIASPKPFADTNMTQAKEESLPKMNSGKSKTKKGKTFIQEELLSLWPNPNEVS